MPAAAQLARHAVPASMPANGGGVVSVPIRWRYILLATDARPSLEAGTPSAVCWTGWSTLSGRVRAGTAYSQQEGCRHPDPVDLRDRAVKRGRRSLQLVLGRP